MAWGFRFNLLLFDSPGAWMLTTHFTCDGTSGVSSVNKSCFDHHLVIETLRNTPYGIHSTLVAEMVNVNGPWDFALAIHFPEAALL